VADPDLARLLDRHDVATIATLPRAAVEHYLERLVGELADDPWDLDADRLVSTGNTLHLAGHARADGALAAALARRPSERTLDAVSLLLAGLWKSGADPRALATLTEVAGALGKLGPDAARSYRTALDTASRSGP
jgi:hypothetical protein